MPYEIKSITEFEYSNLEAEELLSEYDFHRRFGYLVCEGKKYKLAWASDQVDPCVVLFDKYLLIGVDQFVTCIDVENNIIEFKSECASTIIDILKIGSGLYLLLETSLSILNCKNSNFELVESFVEIVSTYSVFSGGIKFTFIDGSKIDVTIDS